MSCPYSHDESTKRSGEEKPRQKTTELETIPQPPMAWFTGNLRELNPDFPMLSIWRLADIYGPIYKLTIIDREVVVISTQELINEVCDDDRFEKIVSGALKEVRALVKDGLFTAHGHEPVSRRRAEPGRRHSEKLVELVESPPHPDSRFWANVHSQDVPRDA